MQSIEPATSGSPRSDLSRSGTGSVLVFGDALGLPESLKALPEGRAIGLVAAEIRPHEHPVLQELAARNGIPLLIQPRRGATAYAEFSRSVRRLSPDFILTNSYSMLLPPDILASARVAAVNVHGGLLPEYRGSNPLQWALILGERETGVTMHFMDAGFDTGAVIATRRVPIHLEDTWVDVFARLRQATQAILAEHLPAVLEGRARGAPQDESRARHHRRRHPDDGRIDWQARVIDIHNLIRALVPPMPGAFYEANGRRVVLDRYHSLAEVAALKLEHGHRHEFRIRTSAHPSSTDPALTLEVGAEASTGCGTIHSLDFEARTARIEVGRGSVAPDAVRNSLIGFARDELGLAVVGT